MEKFPVVPCGLIANSWFNGTIMQMVLCSAKLPYQSITVGHSSDFGEKKNYFHPTG